MLLYLPDKSDIQLISSISENIKIALTSAQYNGIYYINAREDNFIYTNKAISIKMGAFKENTRATLIVLDKNLLYDYKKNTEEYFGEKYYEYIFAYTGPPIRALNANSKKEVDLAIKNKLILVDNYKSFIDDIDIGEYVPVKDTGDLFTEEFFKKYQGYAYKNKIFLFIFDNYKKLLPYFKLVDGNHLRYDTGIETNEAFDMPAFVISELEEYFKYPETSLSKKTTLWLQENFKKPYANITVYRGVSIDVPNDVKELKKIIKKQYNISKITDIKKEGKVIVHRGKESSWTTIPIIAKSFMGNSWNKYPLMAFILKTNISLDKVLFDTNILPKAFLKKNFSTWMQNEVILGKYDIPAIISQIFVNKQGIEQLAELGYNFKANIGITKSKEGK